MRIPLAVHESNSFKQLLGKALHVVSRIPMIPILLDDIEQRRAKWLKDHTEMPMMIEGLFEPNYMCFIIWISLVECLYDISL